MQKHGIRFADTFAVFEDAKALTVTTLSREKRACDRRHGLLRPLLVVSTRGARQHPNNLSTSANRHEEGHYEANYDFTAGVGVRWFRRVREERITIRLDTRY